jgi:hypothetical protein
MVQKVHMLPQRTVVEDVAVFSGPSAEERQGIRCRDWKIPYD